MSRYIDADKLINDLDYDVSCYPGGNDKSYIQVCDFKSMINGQPTADVVEVKRGKWIRHEQDGAIFADYECSVCSAYPTGGIRSNYCPNCGADMRGDSQ